MTGLSGLVTINSLTVIAVDRYCAIVIRVKSVSPAPKWKTYKATIVIWTYALFWSLSPVLGWSKYQLEGVRTTCSFDYLTRDATTISFIVAIATCEFAIPVTVIILAYCKIVTAMIVRRRNLSICKKSENSSLNFRLQRYRVRAEIRTAFYHYWSSVSFCRLLVTVHGDCHGGSVWGQDADNPLPVICSRPDS